VVGVPGSPGTAGGSTVPAVKGPAAPGRRRFEAVKEIANKPAAAAAFGTAAGDARYDTPWAPNGYPRRG
jgi:hypothetical protein